MTREGQIVGKPWELSKAELMDGLCQRWGCLPSQLAKEDAHEVFQLLNTLGLAAESSDKGQAAEFRESDLGLDMRTLGG